MAGPLTFCAVLSLPARVAYDLPTLAARKVSESVVAGSAENRAAVAIVVLVAQEAVGVAQLGSAGCLHVFRPLVSHSKMALGGDPADQTIRVVCKDKRGSCQLQQQASNCCHTVSSSHRVSVSYAFWSGFCFLYDFTQTEKEGS